MQLKEWRKEKKMSQVELAAALQDYVRSQKGQPEKKLRQSTVGCWEQGTLPRKWWLQVIKDFTKGKVTPGDFLLTGPNFPAMSKATKEKAAQELDVIRHGA